MNIKIETAKRLARLRGWTNKAHIGVFVKGFLAAIDGKDAKDCPYKPTPGGGACNGSFAWPKAWHEGFKDGKESLQ